MNTSHHLHAARRAQAEPAPQVTLLVTAGCHLCEHARVELARRAEHGELDLAVVSLDSDHGRALQARHRPLAFPLVLIDGRWFSAGRLPQRRLDRALVRRRAR